MCACVRVPTQQLVGFGGGEVELLLEVFGQEGCEAGHDGDLHASRQGDAGEHGVGQEVLGHLGDHCGTKGHERKRDETCMRCICTQGHDGKESGGRSDCVHNALFYMSAL